jgi:hypothetical protein
MSDVPRKSAPGLLARGLKLVGRLTSPETRTGRVFVRVESRLTRVTARMNEHPTWLRIGGTALRAQLELRIRRHALVRRALNALDIPMGTELEAVRARLRKLDEQVEAATTQLELLEREAREQRAQTPPEAPAREPRRSVG